jgi:beta-aspartyl-peptidase (threonine type)
MAYGAYSVADAADAVIMQRVPELGGDGGAIAVDHEGNIAMPFSTAGMYRGWIAMNGSRGTAIFRD